MATQTLTRRNFLAVSAGGLLTAASRNKVKGANDRVRAGIIGCGGRGTELLREILHRNKKGLGLEIAAVCDIWDTRKDRAKQITGAEVHHRWQDLIERNDLDGVIIAVPDHWHSAMAIAAMETGKDVYCEKPMTQYADEAKTFRNKAVATKRIVQIGTQYTSEGQWHLAHDLIQAGKIGKVVWSQSSYSRNSKGGEWNYAIDKSAAPDNLDWEAFLGRAPKREFSPERYFRWRKYWDYSGGIATDLHYHMLAPLLLAIGPEFPERVSAAGGIYVHDDREVPDTFMMTAEFPSGHTIIQASSMANSNALPSVIRGHEATLEFHKQTVKVKPEAPYRKVFESRFGSRKEVDIEAPERAPHITNWVDCVKSRQKCACDEELGYRTMVAIGMSIEAYRKGRTLYFDRDSEEIVQSPPRDIA